jgi:hypothetical protein
VDATATQQIQRRPSSLDQQVEEDAYMELEVASKVVATPSCGASSR